MKKLLLLLCIVFYSNELFSAAADPYEPLTYEQVEAFFATPPEESGAAANPTPVSSHISSEDEMLTDLIEHAYYDEDLEKRLLKIQSLEESDQELTPRQKAQIRELYKEYQEKKYQESLQELLADPAYFDPSLTNPSLPLATELAAPISEDPFADYFTIYQGELLDIDPSLLEDPVIQPIVPTLIVEKVKPEIRAQAARDARIEVQPKKGHRARAVATDKRRGVSTEQEKSKEEKAKAKREHQLILQRLRNKKYRDNLRNKNTKGDLDAIA